MSKRDLKKYLNDLPKKDLEEQVLELYDRLKEVKEFYNFVFNPQEDKLLEEAKFKVSKEYFPPARRKAKKRRSVAQKYIRLFQKLGVDPSIIGDLMFYHIEIAQAYNAEKRITQDAFYKAMLKGFKESIQYVDSKGIGNQFNERIEKIVDVTIEQEWENRYSFDAALDVRF